LINQKKQKTGGGVAAREERIPPLTIYKRKKTITINYDIERNLF
jgi:hypothetical protein